MKKTRVLSLLAGVALVALVFRFSTYEQATRECGDRARPGLYGWGCPAATPLPTVRVMAQPTAVIR